MKYLFTLLLLILGLGGSFPIIPAFGEVKNPVAFIGQAVLGATAGAPLSTDSNSQLVSGISNTEVSATADTTTASTTDGVMNAMTITPVSGNWLVNFSTCVDHSAQSVAVVVSLYVDTTRKLDTVRSPVPRFNGVGANTLTPCLSINSVVTVNGSQAISVQWKVASGTGTAHQRTLNIVRLL